MDCWKKNQKTIVHSDPKQFDNLVSKELNRLNKLEHKVDPVHYSLACTSFMQEIKLPAGLINPANQGSQAEVKIVPMFMAVIPFYERGVESVLVEDDLTKNNGVEETSKREL